MPAVSGPCGGAQPVPMHKRGLVCPPGIMRTPADPIIGTRALGGRRVRSTILLSFAATDRSFETETWSTYNPLHGAPSYRSVEAHATALRTRGAAGRHTREIQDEALESRSCTAADCSIVLIARCQTALSSRVERGVHRRLAVERRGQREIRTPTAVDLLRGQPRRSRFASPLVCDCVVRASPSGARVVDKIPRDGGFVVGDDSPVHSRRMDATGETAGGGRCGRRNQAAGGILELHGRPPSTVGVCLFDRGQRLSQGDDSANLALLGFRCANRGLLVKRSKTAAWRRSSMEVLTSDVVARPSVGPDPPPEWAASLRQLIRASRSPDPGPSW